MAMSAEFDSEYYFDINQYLIDNYPKMSLPHRRAICSLALGCIDDSVIETQVDEVVQQYAIEQIGFIDPDTINE